MAVKKQASPPSDDAIQPIYLRRQRQSQISVRIEGVTPLIVHAWDEKAVHMMEMAQQTRTRAKKEPKDPERDFEASRYRLPAGGGDGFPATGFKAAIVGAARLFEGITMTLLKQVIFVEGEGPQQLVPIIGTPERRRDMVRVGTGVADVRYRAMYTPWAAVLRITFNPAVLDAEGVLALVSAAGQGGVGEWRPSAPKGLTGSYGRFDVATDEETAE